MMFPLAPTILEKQPQIHFTVKDNEGLFGASFPADTDELCFTVTGVIKDVDRLKQLFDLFAETLDQLCRIEQTMADEDAWTRWERIGASRLAQFSLLSQWRLASVAHPKHWVAADMKLFYIITSLALLSSAVIQMFAANADPVALNEVAGDYYFGDGLGVNCSLKLTTKGNFSFKWQGCLGTYDSNEGDFGIKNGILRITPKKPNLREGFGGTPTEFYAIRWGSRMYLVPTNDIVEYCSDVNQGSEPRRGNFGHYYLRRNDWDKPVVGKPDVPEQWTSFLLSRPVRGKITELVGKQEAWLDVGADDGILQGMILTARSHGKLIFSQVRVETVEKGQCRIKCQWSDSQLAVGQTVSSRFHE